MVSVNIARSSNGRTSGFGPEYLGSNPSLAASDKIPMFWGFCAIIKLIKIKNMAIIEKKIWPEYFELVSSGKKKFELRLADFNVKEGDILLLEEWYPKTKEYTGRKIEKRVSFILKFNLNDFGQEEVIKEKGLVVIQID